MIDMIDANVYLYLGAGALLVIAIAVIVSKNVNANISKNGFGITSDKKDTKDNVSIKKLRRTKGDIKNRKDQNINVQDVEDSDIKIG